MDFTAFNSYSFIIGASLIIVISFFFNIISAKTNIPSVLLLIILGLLIKEGLEMIGVSDLNLFPILEVLGIVGLIMIVLEAALDLELKREKLSVIWKSFAVALIGLVITSVGIAYLIQIFLNTTLFNALIYAIPLAIMSSAIIIPSVSNLSKEKEEFMVYESTFSDILGIMFFYFLLGSVEAENAKELTLHIVVNISLTIIISVILSYILIYLFHKLGTNIRLFLLIAVLILLYAIGKLMHFSSLIMILIFGLILNNHKFFFKGKLKKIVNKEMIELIYKDFNVITIESSFVVRTFFFVIFGMTIVLSSLMNANVIIISLSILTIIYAVRFLILKLFVRKEISPQVFIAPRGLITILLFFGIPAEYQIVEFDSGILLFTIIISSIIMAYSLIHDGRKAKNGENVELEVINQNKNE